MNLLSGALNYIAGDEIGKASPVTRLIERIKSSALSQDRRSAVEELSRIARTSPVRQREIGQEGLKVLYAIIEQDRDYEDTVRAALELLIHICGQLDSFGDRREDTKEAELLLAESAEVAAENVNSFLALPNAIPLLLDLLGYDDFYVRFNVVELLTAMAVNAKSQVQAAILSTPEGITRLCDALNDPKDLIRSNAVVLLTALSESSPEICKIMTFSGIIDRIFALLDGTENLVDQDDMDGEHLERAVIIQDCLCLLKNLLDATESAQNDLLEGGKVTQLGKQLVKASHFVRNPPAHEGSASNLTKHWISICWNCLHCIQLSVKGNGSDAQGIRTAALNCGILSTAVSLAFETTGGSQAPYVVRVRALRAIGALLHGHEESRKFFKTKSTSSADRASSPQLDTLETFYRDLSLTIRAASLLVFQELFVADPVLNTPSSALLNGFVGAAEVSTQDRASVGDTKGNLHRMFNSLKSALTGWPERADGVAVFCSSILVCWMLSGIDGARERLLRSRVDPSGNLLLLECVRSLGRAERGNAPAAAKIGLLRLLCTWLYKSSSAVISFLSKATHLALLMEMLTKEGSRGDLDQIHVQGLSALLLGICLDVAEGADNREEFVGAGDGASILLTSEKISNLIRSRLGTNSFTALLEDLQASDAYKYATASKLSGHAFLSFAVDELASHDTSGAALSVDNDLGRIRWYDYDFCHIVDDIYKKIGERALDFMVTNVTVQRPASKSSGALYEANGYRDALPNGDAPAPEVLADSTRDELIMSYKDFIRNQDKNLNEARSQVEVLTAALKEARADLDRNNALIGVAGSPSETEELYRSLREAEDRARTLEALLAERNADFEALSQAYGVLETERHAGRSVKDESENLRLSAAVEQLRTQKRSLVEQLDAEASKSVQLEKIISELRNENQNSEVQLEALTHERDELQDLLKRGDAVRTDAVLAAELRRRVAVAEKDSQYYRDVAEKSAAETNSLRRMLREAESTKEEALRAAALAEASSQSARAEIERLQSLRAREVQLAKESASVTAAISKEELVALQTELSALKSSKSKVMSEEEAEELRGRALGLRRERDALLERIETLETELADSRTAVQEWQKRSEAGMRNHEAEQAENARLSNLARQLQGELDSLKAQAAVTSTTSSAASRKLIELESRLSEEQEYHRSTQEELQRLRDEVASRAEQTIRLSGRIYEAEEAKAEADALKDEFSRMKESFARVEEDYRDAEAKCKELEAIVMSLQSAKLSLDEAEESKRILSLQVIELKSELERVREPQQMMRKAADHEDRVGGRELKETKGKLTKLETSYGRLLEEKKVSDDRVTELEGEASRRLLSLRELDQEKSELCDRIRSLQQDLSSSKEENTRMQGHVLALEKTIDNLRVAEESQQHSLTASECGEESEYSLRSLEEELKKRATRAEDNLIALQTASVSVIKHLREELLNMRSNTYLTTAEFIAKLAILEASGIASEELILEQARRGSRELKRKLESSEYHLDLARGESDLLKTHIQNLETSLRSTESALQVSRSEIAGLKSEVVKLRTEVADKAAKTSALTTRTKQLEESSYKKDKELSAGLVKIGELVDGEKELKDLLRIRDLEIRRLEKALQNTSAAADGVHRGLRDLESKISSLEGRKRINHPRNALEPEREQPKVLSERVQQLSRDIAQANEKAFSAEEAKNSALIRVTQLEEEVAMVRASLASSEARAEVYKSFRETECTKLQAEIEILRVARDAAQASVKEESLVWKGKIKDLEGELGNVNNDLVRTKAKLHEAQHSIVEIERERKEEVEKQEALNTCSKEEISALRKENVASNELLKNANEKIVVLKKEVGDQEATNKSLRSQATQTTELLDQLQNDLKTQKGLLEAAQNEARRMKGRIVCLETKLETSEASANTLSSRCTSAEDENRDLVESLQVAREKVRIAEEKVSDTNSRLMEAGHKSERQLADFRRECERHRRARTSLETENENLRGELDSIEGAKLDMEEKLAAALKDNQGLREWVADLEKKAAELQSVARQFEDVELALDDEIKAGREAWEQVASLKKTNEEMESRLSEDKTQLRNVIRERKELLNERDMLRSQLADLNSTLSEIRSSHLTKVREYEENMRKSAARILDLESSIVSAERQIAEAATTGDRIDAMNMEIVQKTTEIQRLESQLQASEEACKELRSRACQLEKEIELERSSSSRQAFADLEAEHNELLVYLAEMEVEQNCGKQYHPQLQSATSGEA